MEERWLVEKRRASDEAKRWKKNNEATSSELLLWPGEVWTFLRTSNYRKQHSTISKTQLGLLFIWLTFLKSNCVKCSFVTNLNRGHNVKRQKSQFFQLTTILVQKEELDSKFRIPYLRRPHNQQSTIIISPTSAIHHMCSVISHAKPCFHHEDGKESVSEWIWKRERKIEICDVGISTRWWVSEDRGRAGALWILWIWSRSSSWDHDGDLYAKSQWMPNDISTGFWFTMIVKARLYVRIYQGDFFVDDDELFRSIFDLCMQSQPTTHHKSPIPQSNWKIPYTTKPQVERYVLMLVTSAPSEKDYDDLPLIGSAVWIAGVYVLLNGLVRSIDETDWWNLQIILSSQKWQLKRGGEWLEILSTCLSDAESLFVRWKGTLARLLARIMNY